MNKLRSDYGEPDTLTVSILGTPWTILFEQDLPEGCEGFSDFSTKEIKIAHFENDGSHEGEIGDLDYFIERVVLHELIHAHLYESGLAFCSDMAEAWAENEEMVDWMALQHNKIEEVMVVVREYLPKRYF